MGALTLKSFPFILRDWDVQSYNSTNFTDSFGQEIHIYINRNQVIKIEPQFSNTNSNIWLTNKGRLFFDSIFNTWNKNNTQPVNLEINKHNSFKELFKSKNINTKIEEQWEIVFKSITKIIYISDICNFKNICKYFFILVFENISLEALNLLFLLTKTHAFIKLRRAENFKNQVNLETSLQINSGTCVSKLSGSSLCLLVTTDTRYEGSYLNLQLRQRYFKGSFKLLTIGSLKSLTFPIFFLGSNISILKTISTGTNATCLDLVNSTNPLVIINSETLKRKDIQHIITIIKMLKHTNIINNVWNGFNYLNFSLTETGINNLTSFSFLTFKDLLFFSSFYIINANINNIKNLKKITESRLLTLNSFSSNLSILKKNKILIVQNHSFKSKNYLKILPFKTNLYLPTNNFFENNETFINTEGLIKKTTKLIVSSKTKSNWQLIRKFTKDLNAISFISTKDKRLLFFNSKNLSNFNNEVNFLYYCTKTLTSSNYLLNDKNKPFLFYKEYEGLKKSTQKLRKTIVKYTINNAYITKKDLFGKNSLSLINCMTDFKKTVCNHRNDINYG